MAAQLPLLDAQGQGFFQQGRGGEGGQQLGVEQGLHQIRRGRQVTNAPVGRKNLREPAHIDGALQTIKRREARGVLWRDVAVGVVLHHVEVVLVGQLQHAVGAARAEAVARGVVEHAHAHVQLGLVHFAIPGHHLQVWPVSAARHGQDAHTEGRQPRKLHRPAGLLHHHRVARAQQRAAHDVQRMRGPHGGDDVLRHRVHVEGGELLGQQAAQVRIAQRLAVLQRKILQAARVGDLAHRSGHEGGLQPLGRKHAHAGLRLVADLVEHAADERRGVDG